VRSNMKSSPSASSNDSNIDLTWDSPLALLFKSKKSKTYTMLSAADYNNLSDLLNILPLKNQLIPPPQSFKSAQEGQLFCGIGKIIKLSAPPNFKRRSRFGFRNLELLVEDASAEKNDEQYLYLKWFNAYPNFIEKIKKLKTINFWGEIKRYKNRLYLYSPRTQEVNGEEENKTKNDNDSGKDRVAINVEYPTINSVSGKFIKQVMNKLPDYLWEEIRETLPEEILNKRSLMPRSTAYKIIHGKIPPLAATEDDAIKRLIYEELYLEQLRLMQKKEAQKKLNSPLISVSPAVVNELLASLPFNLTSGQKQVVDEILQDISANAPMNRLLQGDVGCGKTVVAAIVIAITIKAGHQVAFMCPTETLVLQHSLELKNFFSHLSIRTALLLGSLPVKDKRIIKEGAARGDYDLIIGTHALIQDDLLFNSLALVVIDEQHKFGVNQRHKLVSKGENIHCLTMSATPIPRSLGLTIFGDLDISTIKEMPVGRKQSHTRIIDKNNYGQFLNFLKTRIQMGEQAYIVVPVIDETPNNLHSLEYIFNKFSGLYPEYIFAKLHGRLTSEEKTEIFLSFINKKINILVSTSVIEVGINVPNATIMAIINPERFGLSALHQLRGRVGRGGHPGFCFLVNDGTISAEALARLKVVESTNDGFKIAEQDLINRGEGDLWGIYQSGRNRYRFADIIANQKELLWAREDVVFYNHDRD